MLRSHTSRKAARSAQNFPVQRQGRLIYMVNPEHFDIVQAINPHMCKADGSLNTIDQRKALIQWHALKDVYESLGYSIEVLNSVKGCEDMVFCANQTFPFLDSSHKPSVILSNMADAKRQLEVEPLQMQLGSRSIHCHSLPDRNGETLFEGMGDALWVPGRRLICGGFGPRTRENIYDRVEKISGTTAILFELANSKFYHLDTCLSILDDRTVLACRDGFTSDGWDQLHEIFERVLAVPSEEADAPGFACNAHSPDGKNVILQSGSTVTCGLLEAAGFIPIEVQTSEFIKAGGSVFCMKLQTLWDA